MTIARIAPCGSCRHAAGTTASAGISSSATSRRMPARLAAMSSSASIWISTSNCISAIRQLASPASEMKIERDEICTRGGVPVEELPDPLAPQPPAVGTEAEQAPPPRRRRRWPLILYSVFALLFVTIVWLVITAPLSRALEPLADPALLMLSSDGGPIALRGALKEAPVDVTKLNPQTPAAFVAIEDRRFYRHWGIDLRGIGRAMVANLH